MPSSRPLTYRIAFGDMDGMHEDELAVVRALLPVAWADGHFGEKEREMLRALLDAYHAVPSEADKLLAEAEKPLGLDSIDLQTLSAGDRRVVLSHAVLLTFADGVQEPSEREFLGQLGEHLRIPSEEAQDIVAQATVRARAHLSDL